MTGYEASQVQRGIERKIRQSKRELTALDELGKSIKSADVKNAFASESVKLKREEKKLRDFCNQTGRRRSDQTRVKTASWNKSTAQKAVAANKRVEKDGNGGIIKSITVDDVTLSTHGKNIDSKVIDVINKHMTSGDGFYINEIVCRSVPKEKNGTPLMQIEPYKQGNVYSTRLILNEDVIGGKTVEELDKLCGMQKNTVMQNFNEAVIHETGHAKVVYSNRFGNVEEVIKQLEKQSVGGISKIAAQDGNEAIAEIEVWMSREEVVSEEAMNLYNKYIKKEEEE